jgi:glycerol kinase
MNMARGSFVLAIDQGTTGTHVSILDRRLRVVGRGYRELPQHFPKPGWVEHELGDIWNSVARTVAQALRAAGITGKQVAAIGITNQRETTGVWDRRSGAPLHRAIVWQDRRTSGRCAALKAEGREPRTRDLTGLVLDPYFAGTKLEWLLRNVKGLRARAARGEVCFGTIDTWLVYKLTGHRAHVTDVSNASRTLLLDLKSLGWSQEMCELFDVPPAVLPEVRGSAEVYGETRGLKFLPDGIPVAGMAGDQQAALFGQACFSPGESKCTYGTGAFLLMNTGSVPVKSTSGLLTTVAWRLDGKTTYALEGAAFIAGAAVQWLRDALRIIKRSADVEALARQVKDTGEVVFVPALAGLGAPHWRPQARGLFAGLDRSTTAAHLARAVLEGVALQIDDLALAMRKDSGHDIPVFKVDGGAAANDLMMQFQADLLNVPVVRPKNLETTGLGAAFLGGLGAGVWQSPEEIRAAWRADRTFRPKMKAPERERHLDKWRRAVERA